MVDVEPGRPVGAVGGRDEGGQAGLARGARHRRAGSVHGIHPGVDGGQQGADLAAGGVVGVQVHREVETLPERAHQGARGRRTQQPGHVLDREDVRTGGHDLLGHPEVVVQGVELLARVREVAGVAECHLRDRGAGLQHGLDGGPHLLHVVERVEDPEDVQPGTCGLAHEGVGHRGRVGRVTDGVATAEQHLERDVRHRLP